VARDTDFNQTISAIDQMLRYNTLDLNASFDKILNDSVFIDIELVNKAGHKFPSGYPSRRAILQCIVTKANGDTLFASGKLRSDGELLFPVLPYESHHDIINDQMQNQIYEMVMADVAGNRTTVLERAASVLKDNRLVPKGFSSSFYTYDTCRVVGNASTDVDFNKVAGVQGSGKDIVHYHIPLLGYSGVVTVYTQMFYVSVPPSWLSEMFTFSAFEIDRFKTMYNAADKTPKLVAVDTISNLVIPNSIVRIAENSLQIFPNPSLDGKIEIMSKDLDIQSLDVFDINGKIIQHFDSGAFNMDKVNMQIGNSNGTYFLRFRIGGAQLVKKIIILGK